MEWIVFIAILIIIFVSHASIKNNLEFKIKLLEKDVDILFKKSNATIELLNQKHVKMQKELAEQLSEQSERINYFSHKLVDISRD
ncbi:hypothetical protein [Sulfurimonas sp.]|uniref:hypothetical protein n=1 Tax=Sulfurimonas sp. TaxID=2022749 RepID=UPI0019FF7DB0|nr:hypothetical protein [Sulfurimonas sp.]MBE0515753.1 hypothetical protein [Sulfurimonas sp.]